MISDAQARKLMDEMSRHGRVGVAALRSGMHRNTARRYLEAGTLPSEMKPERNWRTRVDPFLEDWDEVARRLDDAPELERRRSSSGLWLSVRTGTTRGRCGPFNVGSSSGGLPTGLRRRFSSRRSTDLVRPCKRTSPGRRNWRSRSVESPSITCCAIRSCPTAIGSLQCLACRNRCSL